jgi:tRNA threonylcarbamoyladenosine modification (KEOPS) complex  Pcc1 subunit
MDYKAEITVSEDPENIQKCLEQEKISRERSSVSLEKEGDDLKIKVEAKDAVALRATMNAITQVLAVYAKSKQLK